MGCVSWSLVIVSGFSLIFTPEFYFIIKGKRNHNRGLSSMYMNYTGEFSAM